MFIVSCSRKGCSRVVFGYYHLVNEAANDEKVEGNEQYLFPPAGKIENDKRTWGLGHAAIGYSLSLIAALIGLRIVYSATSYNDFDQLPMWAVSLVGFPQQLILGLTVIFAASRFGEGLKKDFLFTMHKKDIGVGLFAGVGAQLLLVPLVTYPIVWLLDIDVERISEPARNLSDRASSPLGVVTLVITVGLFAPLAEELFFRGLLYGSFRKRNNSLQSQKNVVRFSIVISSGIFAAIHFQLLLFPALFAVGILFAWLYERKQRLAPAIWAHIGFNATTLFSLLIID